jgi:hypothetical protein
LRKRKAFKVVGTRDPAARFHQISLYVSGERNGSTKAECAEAQKIDQ